MSPATAWTEIVGTETGWVRGQPIAGFWEDDAYIDILFEVPAGYGLLFNPHTPWAHMTAPSTAGTEMAVPATVWTELT